MDKMLCHNIVICTSHTNFAIMMAGKFLVPYSSVYAQPYVYDNNQQIHYSLLPNNWSSSEPHVY